MADRTEYAVRVVRRETPRGLPLVTLPGPICVDPVTGTVLVDTAYRLSELVGARRAARLCDDPRYRTCSRRAHRSLADCRRRVRGRGDPPS